MRLYPGLFVAGVLTREMNTPATPLVEPQEGRDFPPKQNSTVGYRVAEVRVEMNSPPGGPVLTLPPSLAPFQAGAGPAGITLTVDWADEIPEPSGEVLFDSGGVWTLHRRGSQFEFVFLSPAIGGGPYKTAVMDGDFRCGHVWLSRRVFGARSEVYPLEYPLDELLVIHRLARGEGVEVHACGVADEQGRGLLFLGHSGAGKSTLARLWQSAGRTRILSDDRIILRGDADAPGPGRITMHGTPWHGEARLALPISAPLCGVFLLEHAQGRNELELLPPARAAAELMSRSFLPFHDADGLAFILQFFGDLVAEVPANVFRFLPDASALLEMEKHG